MQNILQTLNGWVKSGTHESLHTVTVLIELYQSEYFVYIVCRTQTRKQTRL